MDDTQSGRPPTWPLVLAGVSSLRDEPSGFAQQIAAAVVGSITVLLMGLAGRQIAGGRAGLVAAGLAAVYPGFWV